MIDKTPDSLLPESPSASEESESPTPAATRPLRKKKKTPSGVKDPMPGVIARTRSDLDRSRQGLQPIVENFPLEQKVDG